MGEGAVPFRTAWFAVDRELHPVKAVGCPAVDGFAQLAEGPIVPADLFDADRCISLLGLVSLGMASGKRDRQGQ